MKARKMQSALSTMRDGLEAGRVYRRADLLHLSSAVDRHLAALVKDGSLKKLNQGLYLCPEKTAFGEAPASPNELMRSFLKDDHFVVYSPSDFNSLGLGTTQLYNKTIVFNRKRNGEFTLGGRKFFFQQWREAPKNASKEFLLVEMVNRLNELAEDRNQIMSRLKDKLPEFNRLKLKFALNHYGNRSTQQKFNEMMGE
jgi:hypothetical protein